MSQLFDNPYASDGAWLRGNLHTHTKFSDGTRDILRVFEDYESRGYDFLAISDHDIFINPDGYRDKTRLTLLPAVEVSARGPHIQHVGATAKIEPEQDRQTVIDNILAQGAFAVLNHPNWGRTFNHCPHDLMESLTGYVGIELYNGVIERLEGSPLATDRWDRLLSAGRRVWGFGNDDSHDDCDMELAWNVVHVRENTPTAIMDALRAGNFYASTGVVIRDIAVNGSVFRVETKDARRIRFVGKHGIYLQTTDGDSAEYRLPEDGEAAKRIGYVRAECYGVGGRAAWTQPLIARA